MLSERERHGNMCQHFGKQTSGLQKRPAKFLQAPSKTWYNQKQEAEIYSVCISHHLLLSVNVQPLCKSTDLVKSIKCEEALVIMFRGEFFVGYTVYMCVVRWHCSHKHNIMIHSLAVISNTDTQRIHTHT